MQQAIGKEIGKGIYDNWELRQWIQVLEFGNMSSVVTVVFGSDWAGDTETRKISSAGVALVGRHLLKSYTRKHENHRQKQCRSRVECSSIGSIRRERRQDHVA